MADMIEAIAELILEGIIDLIGELLKGIKQRVSRFASHSYVNRIVRLRGSQPLKENERGRNRIPFHF